MIGARAIALTPLVPEGRISYAGENWAATIEPRTRFIEAGSSVRITAVEGLRLRVQPVYILKSDVDPPE
jgi:membrane protein implicated in regulation of membrane protease activity